MNNINVNRIYPANPTNNIRYGGKLYVIYVVCPRVGSVMFKLWDKMVEKFVCEIL